MKTVGIVKNRVVVRLITLLVIAALVCQNVVWAGGDKKGLYKKCKSERQVLAPWHGGEHARDLWEQEPERDDPRLRMIERDLRERFPAGFTKVGELPGERGPYPIYQHNKTKIRIVEKHYVPSLKGDLKALRQAKLRNCCPILGIDEKWSYYELYLKPYGYKRIKDVFLQLERDEDYSRMRLLIKAVFVNLFALSKERFTHGHLHVDNIMINPETGEIKIVDFRFMSQLYPRGRTLVRNLLHFAVRDENLRIRYSGDPLAEIAYEETFRFCSPEDPAILRERFMKILPDVGSPGIADFQAFEIACLPQEQFDEFYRLVTEEKLSETKAWEQLGEDKLDVIADYAELQVQKIAEEIKEALAELPPTGNKEIDRLMSRLPDTVAGLTANIAGGDTAVDSENADPGVEGDGSGDSGDSQMTWRDLIKNILVLGISGYAMSRFIALFLFMIRDLAQRFAYYDFSVYLDGVKIWFAGLQPYLLVSSYVATPINILLFYPLNYLAQCTSNVFSYQVWIMATALTLGTGFILLSKKVAAVFSSRPAWRGILLLVPLIFAGIPTIDNLAYGQINLLYIAPIVFSLLLYPKDDERGHWLKLCGIGFLLAFSIWVKIFPGIVLVYFMLPLMQKIVSLTRRQEKLEMSRRDKKDLQIFGWTLFHLAWMGLGLISYFKVETFLNCKTALEALNERLATFHTQSFYEQGKFLLLGQFRLGLLYFFDILMKYVLYLPPILLIKYFYSCLTDTRIRNKSIYLHLSFLLPLVLFNYMKETYYSELLYIAYIVYLFYIGAMEASWRKRLYQLLLFTGGVLALNPFVSQINIFRPSMLPSITSLAHAAHCFLSDTVLLLLSYLIFFSKDGVKNKGEPKTYDNRGLDNKAAENLDGVLDEAV